MYSLEQQQVINHPLNQHAKVIAVAGAGKTTTLIGRIQYLMEQGIQPSDIGVFMFNKNAQIEFMQKLQQHLTSHGHAQSPKVMTFHGFAFQLCALLERKQLIAPAKLITHEFPLIKLIRQSRISINNEIANTSILDEKDWLEDFLLFYEQVKAMARSAKEVFAASTWQADRDFFVPLYNKVDQLRKENGLRFFSDLLLDPLQYLTSISDDGLAIHEGIVPPYKHLLIDEFQDINITQYELLKHLWFKQSSWMIVGDPQQCIYEWRGADPSIMQTKFDKDFDNDSNKKVSVVSHYRLKCSYRFGHQIGLMASHVLQQNDFDALVIGSQKRTEFNFANNHKVGSSALFEIKHWLKQGKAISDIGILVRRYSDMVPIQLALMHSSVPYQLHGDSPLLENKEIRMLMAYLSVMAGGFDHTKLFYQRSDVGYLVNIPSLGLSGRQKTMIEQECTLSPHLIPNIIERVGDESAGWRAKKIYQRADWLRSLTLYRNEPAKGLLETMDKLNIVKYFEASCSQEIQAFEKQATCHAFISYVEKMGGTAQEVLHHLIQLSEHQAADDGLHLMTIHKSKGLEFSLVMVSGLVEGRFPYLEKGESAASMMAERRLYYVAITRAKERLVLLQKPSKAELSQLEKGIHILNYKDNDSSRFIFESQPVVVSNLLNSQIQTKKIRVSNSRLVHNYLVEAIDLTTADFHFESADKEKQDEFQLGERVIHQKYGEGKVVKLGSNTDLKLTIDFEKDGLKKLNPSISRLVSVK